MKEKVMGVVDSLLSPVQQRTMLLRSLSIAKVPLLAACTPSVVKDEDDCCVVRIPLNYVTKNHVGSMYFGALSMGAELSVAFPVVVAVFQKRLPVNFLFTDFSCRFLKKAKEDIYFVFNDVERLQQLIAKIVAEGGSEAVELEGKAFLKSQWKSEEDPVAEYKITISLKGTRK